MPTAMDWPTNESSPQPPKAPPAPGRYCPGRKVAGPISSEGAGRRGQGQGAGGHDRSTRSAHPRRPVVSVVAANPIWGLNTKDITWTVQNTANWQALFDYQKHRGTRHVHTPPPASGTGQVPPSAQVQPSCSGNRRKATNGCSKVELRTAELLRLAISLCCSTRLAATLFSNRFAPLLGN